MFRSVLVITMAFDTWFRCPPNAQKSVQWLGENDFSLQHFHLPPGILFVFQDNVTELARLVTTHFTVDYRIVLGCIEHTSQTFRSEMSNFFRSDSDNVSGNQLRHRCLAYYFP